MDKDNLPQEELSKEFNVIGGIAFDYASDAYKPQVREVCRQIREIVGWYFDNGVAQIVGDLKKTEDMEIGEILFGKERHEAQKQRVEEQQKPTVSEKEMMDELFFGQGFGLNDVRRMIDWLKSKGVGVVE